MKFKTPGVVLAAVALAVGMSACASSKSGGTSSSSGAAGSVGKSGACRW